MYTPYDMLDYVYKKDFTKDFLMSVTRNVGGYSIGEIVDKEFCTAATGELRFKSAGYGIDVAIDDADVFAAVMNKQYVSAFISRLGDKYNVHFLVHKFKSAEKASFEDNILDEVLRYMILHTIVALRLDNKEKIRKYCNAPEYGEDE